MKVKDVPPGRLLSIDPGTSLAELAKRMRVGGADSAAVMSEGRLVGIVTERDSCARSPTPWIQSRRPPP